MGFHSKLYRLRKQHGLSQEELAYRLNVSRQTISKWEVGETSPDLEKLVDMSNLFNISLDELVLDKEPSEIKEPETNFQQMVNYFETHIATSQNKQNLRKIVKYILWAGLAVLGIELLMMIAYVIKNGIPPL